MGTTDPTFVDISSQLATHAEQRPEKAALHCAGRTRTFGDLDRRLNRIANALIDLGVRPGNNVCLLGPSGLETIELFLGIIRAGGCAVPLPATATPATLEKMVTDCNATAIAMFGFEQEDQWNGLGAGTTAPRLAFGIERRGWLAGESLVSVAPADRPVTPVDPQAPFNIIYSSGTTQSPRGILHAHRMRSFQIARMIGLGLGPDSTMLIATPHYSNTTLVALLPTLAAGGQAVLLPKFDTTRFFELSEAHACTHTMLVPVQYRRLLDSTAFARFDLNRYRQKFCTGAFLPVNWKEEILARWPGNLLEIYGQTEGGVTAVLNGERDRHKLDSVGRPANGVEVRILDEHDREQPRGRTGEIVGRAVSMMTGYYGRPGLTESLTWRDGADRIFFRTGDLGYIDDAGFLYLVGRKKEVIVTGGVNVYASDIEQELLAHEAVADAAVIGVPSERWGETPLALVVLKPQCHLTGEALRQWVNRRVGKTQRLSRVEIRDTILRNPAGKVLKRELRAPYWKEQLP